MTCCNTHSGYYVCNCSSVFIVLCSVDVLYYVGKCPLSLYSMYNTIIPNHMHLPVRVLGLSDLVFMTTVPISEFFSSKCS